MSGKPSNNPFVRQLELLMTGYGYNFYDRKNQARADDLLIRQKAAGSLHQAAETVANLEAEFQHRFIPAATRENPYPPAEQLEKLRGLSQLREQVQALAARIRGMPVPTQDKTWWRFRQELPLLNELIRFDCQLVQQTTDLQQRIYNLSADMWQQGGEAVQFGGALRNLDRLIQERQQFLQLRV